MGEDKIRYRTAQKDLVEAALTKIGTGEKFVVADIFPGTGKTLGALAAGNECYRGDLIDSYVALVPRLNLCSQYELDWDTARDEGMFAPPVMGAIAHRDNNPPLRRDEEFGYVSTYASVLAQAGIHLDYMRRHRTLLVLDEAQQLGWDDRLNMGTQSANLVRELAKEAEGVLVLSGTPVRGDGKKLILSKYSKPDDDGLRYLLPDVEASYRQGVNEGYLCETSYELCDASGIHRFFDGDSEPVQLSSMRSKLHRILDHQDFWSEMVDKTVEEVRKVQNIHPSLCGLIAAYNQGQADRIEHYVRSRHPSVKVLKAISRDQKQAQENLEAFKGGGYDLLISVRMAYVGYDHKPIKVICPLTDFREHSFLCQLFMRAGRVVPGLPPGAQILRAVVPDDPKMQEFVEWLRHESDKGVKDKEPGSEPGPGPGGDVRLGYTESVNWLGERAEGLDEGDSVSREDYPAIAAIQKEYEAYEIPVPKLGRLLKGVGALPSANGGATHKAPETDTNGNGARKSRMQKERLFSADLYKEFRKEDSTLGRAGVIRIPEDFGYSARKCQKAFNDYRPPKEMSMAELLERERWLNEVWRPQVREVVGNA